MIRVILNKLDNIMKAVRRVLMNRELEGRVASKVSGLFERVGGRRGTVTRGYEGILEDIEQLYAGGYELYVVASGLCAFAMSAWIGSIICAMRLDTSLVDDLQLRRSLQTPSIPGGKSGQTTWTITPKRCLLVLGRSSTQGSRSARLLSFIWIHRFQTQRNQISESASTLNQA